MPTPFFCALLVELVFIIPLPCAAQTQEKTPVAALLFPTYTASAPAQLDHPALVAFWRSDCTPCRTEMPVLEKIARQNPQLAIDLMGLEEPKTLAAVFANHPLPANLHVLVHSEKPAALLRQYGNTRNILPFAAFLDKTGAVCKTHYGILGTDRVQEWMKLCSN